MSVVGVGICGGIRMEFKIVPQDNETLIKLAKYISSFKTIEMEIAFAKVMMKHLNPFIIAGEPDDPTT